MHGIAEINALEICAVALRRSGHHAILRSLLRQLRGDGFYFDNCKIESSPYLRKEVGHASGSIDFARERPGSFTPKDYLVHSYENTNLVKIFSPSRLKKWDELVGTSRRRVHLLILRDPFNNFASLVRWSQRHTPGDTVAPSPETVRRCAELWKRYAREYLGLTDIIPGEKIGVSYNAWFTDRHERKKLADRLHLDFTDEGIENVARGGAHVGPVSIGSSFDGFSYDGRAQEMRVLERFRDHEDDPFYLGLFDAEIIDLSKRIFGEVPGTERIVASVPGSSKWRRLGVRASRAILRPVRPDPCEIGLR